MTKERLEGIKSIIHEKTIYYSNIGFDNLANEFANVENFLSEIEEVLEENEKLKTQLAANEEKKVKEE